MRSIEHSDAEANWQEAKNRKVEEYAALGIVRIVPEKDVPEGDVDADGKAPAPEDDSAEVAEAWLDALKTAFPAASRVH